MESPGGGRQTRVLVFTHYPNMAQTESCIGINGKYWKKTLICRDAWIATNSCRYVSVDGQQSRCHIKYRSDTQQRIDLSNEAAAFPKSFQFAHIPVSATALQHSDRVHRCFFLVWVCHHCLRLLVLTW